MDVRRLLLFALLIIATGCGARSQVNNNSFVQDTDPGCVDNAVPDRFVVEWTDGRITVEHAKNRDEFFEKILEPNSDLIKRAQHDQRVQLMGEPLVNIFATDPLLPPKDWGQTAIGAADLWNANIKGEGVIVAVIDTGIDLKHPALKGRLYVNPNEIPNDGVDNDVNGYVDDVSGWNFVEDNNLPKDDLGHGTHVAGIVAAEHGGEEDPKGVAPKAKILPLRFLNAQGSGFLSDAVVALNYAISKGARVVNASWGGPQCLQSLKDAIDTLPAKDVLFIAAAGNSGVNLTYHPQYPAAFSGPTQLTVGASTYRGLMAGFSNHGTPVHFVAPGQDIFSAFWNGSIGSSYAWQSGTSMAAPFVSGMAALLISARPDLTAVQVRRSLLETVTKPFCCTATEGEANVSKAAKSLGIIP